MACVAVAAIPMTLAVDAGSARAQAIPESVWRIPAPAASPAAEPRYLDEMRTVVDAIGGDSSNGHRYGVRAYGWVYGHGLTTDDAVRIEVSAGGRPVAEARCRVESPPDESSLLAMGTFLGGYFSCSTERTIEALGDLSVAFIYQDDANDRRIPLRTFAVRSAAAYSWSGSDTHIGVPYIYAADRLASTALWLRRGPFGESAVFFSFWAAPRGAFSRPDGDDLQLRCDRDGTRLTTVQAIGRMLHQVGGNTASHAPRGAEQDEFGMVRYELRTNFSYRGAGGQRPDAHDLAANPGAYTCQIRFRGEPVREMRFTVAANGDIGPHPEQVGPGAVVLTPGMTLVDTRFPAPTTWERGIVSDAIRAGSFAGRPWTSPASVQPMLDALPRDAGALEPTPPAGRIEGPTRAGASGRAGAAAPAGGGRARRR
jgi:hypothetical protein